MLEPQKAAEKDPYWWTPWAVLAALVLYGLLGFVGVFGTKKGGPTAADVPVVMPSGAAPAVAAPQE